MDSHAAASGGGKWDGVRRLGEARGACYCRNGNELSAHVCVCLRGWPCKRCPSAASPHASALHSSNSFSTSAISRPKAATTAAISRRASAFASSSARAAAARASCMRLSSSATEPPEMPMAALMASRMRSLCDKRRGAALSLDASVGGVGGSSGHVPNRADACGLKGSRSLCAKEGWGAGGQGAGMLACVSACIPRGRSRFPQRERVTNPSSLPPPRRRDVQGCGLGSEARTSLARSFASAPCALAASSAVSIAASRCSSSKAQARASANASACPTASTARSSENRAVSRAVASRRSRSRSASGPLALAPPRSSRRARARLRAAASLASPRLKRSRGRHRFHLRRNGPRHHVGVGLNRPGPTQPLAHLTAETRPACRRRLSRSLPVRLRHRRWRRHRRLIGLGGGRGGLGLELFLARSRPCPQPQLGLGLGELVLRRFQGRPGLIPLLGHLTQCGRQLRRTLLGCSAPAGRVQHVGHLAVQPRRRQQEGAAASAHPAVLLLHVVQP
eukprot:scaffold21834_cov123-Isochrysis_galbana.AAC.7